MVGLVGDAWKQETESGKKRMWSQNLFRQPGWRA